jgi:hypothetical protein
MVYLITGTCGTGKTWVMKQLIKCLNLTNIYSYKKGLYQYLMKGGYIIVGKYDGSTFEGSDRLSMSVMKDNDKVKDDFLMNTVVCEGDRFTNSSFIRDFNPIILRINGDGIEGRAKRGSSQTERHLKSITTRVNNITPHFEFDDAAACLKYLTNIICPENPPKDRTVMVQ